MTLTQFEETIAQLNSRRAAIVSRKRPEYTEGHSDVLANFKTVARELGITPEQVWYVYFRKHVASISQYAADPSRATSEPITERICDAINYLELLAALIEDRKQG